MVGKDLCLYIYIVDLENYMEKGLSVDEGKMEDFMK